VRSGDATAKVLSGHPESSPGFRTRQLLFALPSLPPAIAAVILPVGEHFTPEYLRSYRLLPLDVSGEQLRMATLSRSIGLRSTSPFDCMIGLMRRRSPRLWRAAGRQVQAASPATPWTPLGRLARERSNRIRSRD